MAQRKVQCDVCRLVGTVLENPQGVTSLGRCTFTRLCAGSLHYVANTTKVTGKSQFRRSLYKHVQAVRDTEWVINHGLGGRPLVTTFVGDESQLLPVPATPQTIQYLDGSVCVLKFAIPTAGRADLLLLNTTPVTQLATPTTSASLVQTSGASNVVTVASVGSGPTSLAMEFYAGTGVVNLDFVSLSHDERTSPWYSIPEIVVDYTTRMYVRSFIPLTTPLGSDVLVSGDIPNGTSGRVTLVNGAPIQPKQLLLLLAKPPYDYVDRNYNQYVDLSSALITYINGAFYVRLADVVDAYPPLIHE